MAAFINNDITAAGLIVLAKGAAGQKITYTKIVLGDGYLEEGQTPRSLTGVVSPKAVIDITKLKVNTDGTVAVGGIFTNDQTSDGFFYGELGLYAEDPDPAVGEVLYCYGNCGDLAEWIPPTGGATIVEKTIDIVTAIGTATNVTAPSLAKGTTPRKRINCSGRALKRSLFGSNERNGIGGVPQLSASHSTTRSNSRTFSFSRICNAEMRKIRPSVGKAFRCSFNIDA